MCERHHFLLYILPTMSFFLRLLSFPTSCMAPRKKHNIPKGGILCDMENMKISYNLILAAWHLEEREIDLDFF